MKFELEEYHRGITDEELIADLKRVANELNKKSVPISSRNPSFQRYNERGKYDSSTLARRFGSWSEALKRAGLQMNRQPLRISEEELFQNIEEIWVKLGRQPRNSEIRKPLSKYSHGIYEKRFGTWLKALKKFVAYINNEESISSGATLSFTSDHAKSLLELTQGVPPISIPALQSKPAPDFVAKIAEDPYRKEATKKLKIEPNARHKTKRNINWRLRFVVMRRDNFKCKNCGRSPAMNPGIVLHVDHIKAWTNGGETVLENLQTLCSMCNIGKSNLDQEVANKTQSQNLNKGGDGGQIFIISEKMSGNGSISVDGGTGEVGGNAGNVHIESKINKYKGNISAKGGKSKRAN